MKKKKIIISIILVIILSGALLLINLFFGNPISKMIVQKEYLKYYETTYNQKFFVYDSEYNPLIPAYIFEIGPESIKGIKFKTSLYSQGITDEYGGILAASKLSKDLGSILQTEYGHLNYEISASEDPLIWNAVESADYFETDPNVRVLKNHYLLVISLADQKVNGSELKEISSRMVKTIETQLPYHTPNLKVNIKLKSEQVAWESDNKESMEKIFQLFPTIK